jgi:histidinol-phosphate aminotransferase
VDFPQDYTLPAELLHCGAQLVMLANPNAPTGTFVDPERVRAFAEQLDGVLLVDEAYGDFAEDDCLRLVETCPNVVVSRTLSKSYSLAGLRFGYAIAQETLIEGLMKAKDSYNVNALTAAGAAAAIRDQDWLERNVQRIRTTRRRMAEGLRRLGFDCLPSQANFVLARVPGERNAKQVFEALFQRKVLVRYFDMARVDDCLRITVGTEQETDALLDALRAIMQN